MFRSIKARLTLTICGVLLLVFSVQMAVNFLFAERFYELQKMSLLKEVYKQITDLTQDSDSTMEDLMNSLDIDNSIEVILADENKNIIFNNRPVLIHPIMDEPHEKEFNFKFEKYPEAYYKTSGPTLLKSDIEDESRIKLLAKLDYQGSIYYLALQIPIKSISREMQSANVFILYMSSIALVISGLIVYFIAKQFAKPIEDINKVAVSVSKLDFKTRAKVTNRKDEIGSLASNINIMADRLEADIINLREANKKLEYDNEVMNKIDEQRKELIANISHELKTPLAILTGYTEMLNNDVPGIDKSFYYETILDETSKMDVMIKNLLNLSNMENKLTHLNIEKIDIAELADWIFRKSSILMNNKGIKNEFISKPCELVMVDPMYLEEAINNYISNAIRYTKEGSWIRMRVEQVKDEVVISVFNEGINIDEAHVEKIWNSFYREDKSRTRTSENNIGLGLYIVRSIMNASHGKCGVINKENGVVFWLALKTQ